MELKLARIAVQLSASQVNPFTFCIGDDSIFFTSTACAVRFSYAESHK